MKTLPAFILKVFFLSVIGLWGTSQAMDWNHIYPPLIGNIHVNIVYVESPYCYDWDTPGMTAARQKVRSAFAEIIDKAPIRPDGGNYLSTTVTETHFGPVVISTDPETTEAQGADDEPWMNQAIRNLNNDNFFDVTELNAWSKKSHDVDTAFTIFIINYGGRSRKAKNVQAIAKFYYTSCGWLGCLPAYDWDAYLHEILHIFGAMDEYAGVRQCPDATVCNGSYSPWYYPNSGCTYCDSTPSVMKSNSTVISSSTRNFIGWGDHDKDGILDPEDYCRYTDADSDAKCLGCPVTNCDSCDSAECDEQLLLSNNNQLNQNILFSTDKCGSTEICLTYYQDIDSDTYGNPDVMTTRIDPPLGYVLNNNEDCNDSDGTIHPGAEEFCNLVDDNCNSQIDEGSHPQGDLNSDCNVTLKDCIAALQVTAGLPLQSSTIPGEGIHLGGEVNGDGRIGLEETVFILKSLGQSP